MENIGFLFSFSFGEDVDEERGWGGGLVVGSRGETDKTRFDRLDFEPNPPPAPPLVNLLKSLRPSDNFATRRLPKYPRIHGEIAQFTTT